MDNREQVVELVARAEASHLALRLANEVLALVTSAERKFAYQRDAAQRQLQAINTELKRLGFHDSGHAKGELAKP